jgi:hypothetical protein
MRAFLARIDVFNGRYEKSKHVTVHASSIRVAVQRAAWQYKDLIPPRHKVERLRITVTALKGCKPIIEDVEQG